MYRLPVLILATFCIFSGYCQAASEKNGGTVHFDNEEVYNNYPSRKPVSANKQTAVLPMSTESEEPSMMSGALHPPPPEGQNKIDVNPKPMETILPTPSAMGDNPPAPVNSYPQLQSSNSMSVNNYPPLAANNPMFVNGYPPVGSSGYPLGTNHPYPFEYPLPYVPAPSNVAAASSPEAAVNQDRFNEWGSHKMTKDEVLTKPEALTSSPETAVAQDRFNKWGAQKMSIDEILNKPEAVNVPQSVLENKKNVLQNEKVSEILQRGITQMTLDMDKTIRAQGAKYNNVVFSPLSVIGALALVLLGADGATKNELTNFMGIATGRNLANKSDVIHKSLGGLFDALMPKAGVPVAAEVQIANGVFYEDRFKVKRQYEQLAREFYKSEIFPLDFAKSESANFVNKWVSKKTMGKIENLLPGPLSPQISLILANVIYFNGKWEYPFMAKHNTWDMFEQYSASGRKEMIRVEMMTNMARVEYSNTPDAQVLGLPYKGKEVYMYFILPKRSDLEDFTSDLDYRKFSNIINSTVEVDVIYSIPKLKITSSIELRPVLNAMNVTSMFDASRADLSNMLGEDGATQNGVAVDQVFHKIDIDVNEFGTEAAAATGIIITRISKPIVKVNRPFIFFIYHQPTNSIVFWGSMYKPEPYRPL